MPALGDQDRLGPGGVAVLAEDPGGLLVRAGVVDRLPAQPGGAGHVVPRPPGGTLRLLEPVVGEAHDDVPRRPAPGVVGQERGPGVGEVHPGRDRLPAQVHAAADGRGNGLDGIGLLAGPARSLIAEGAVRADEPALDGGPVEHHLPGGLEPVDQAHRALHVRLHQVQRVPAWVVQLRARRVKKLPIAAARNPRSPPVAHRFCSSTSPSMLTPCAASSECPSGWLRMASLRRRSPWMRAPLSRTVPCTGTCSPTVKVDSSSVLVRSSAVRPGACSEQPGPTDTLPSWLRDRSMPPVTWEVPSKVSSAPTVRRGALRAVPPTRDLE